ncbi:MAG TPA: hypothetical protein VGL20_06280 [Candidatus Dormibacteraeota bacterium]
MNRLLDVWLRGELSQSRLDRLRELLSLTRRGRLTDAEDAEFGYRYLGEDAPDRTVLQLYRDGDSLWKLSLEYQGEPPSPETVEETRRAILTAASKLGLAVDQIWPSAEGL